MLAQQLLAISSAGQFLSGCASWLCLMEEPSLYVDKFVYLLLLH